MITEVESAIGQALQSWSAVINVTFAPTTTAGLDNSIDFSFGDVDGALRTLAYAYLPDDVTSGALAGDITFDSAESWEVGNAQGSAATDFLWVTTR